ncbi:GNAT family N-acetyltransferase [Zoogloea sp.]|uniref:GNAT family N-acetyltransferase n=1 Tax=Zoogloea sp. TaxID=49181 RepID=UPI0031FBB67D
MRSFARSVADTVSEEGVSTFSRVADGGAFLGRMKVDNLMLVAEDDEAIRGVIELKEGRHLAMLFVAPDYQRKGVGKRLLSAALDHARVNTVTVRASLSSVPAYKKYGFECTGEVGESAGLTYQPMALQRDRLLLSAD